jgi:outer membrane autotransporter protein
MRARVYLGAAWEHEFDGRARATAYGFETPSPSLRGDTGLFELGLELATKKARAMTINVGLQGYTGKRQGVGGSAQLRYAF